MLAGAEVLVRSGSLPAGATLDADLCIVGAGAAGVTLALALRGSGLRVCVLEGGGSGGSAVAADALAGESVGLPYPLARAREAGLGGTTRTWAGWCRPLDPIDFERRPGGAAGWPFGADELAPHYLRAHEILGLGPFVYEPAEVATGSRPVLPTEPSRLRTRVWRFATRLRFGDVHRRALADASGLRVVLGAWATRVEVDDARRSSRSVRAVRPDGSPVTVRARAFVLAAGGIENARLLLDSEPGRGPGLGNESGLVGRFFAEHPYVNAARLRLADGRRPLTFYHRHRSAGWPLQGVLTLADEVVRREGLLRCGVIFPAPHAVHPDWGSPGVVALRRLAHAAGGIRPGEVPALVARVVANAGAVARSAARAVPLRRPDHLVVRAFLESASHAGSRVTLSEARDRLGRRRARVEWRLGELERASLRRTLQILAEEMERSGTGCVEPVPDDPELGWPAGLGGGRHHIGTTRMSDDPAQGVVDRQGRVHGLANVYVAGSSVFPTTGLANPTLTIVAMALRLAGHLRRRLAAREDA